MPADPRGSVFETAGGDGIRWPEDGRRPQRSGFTTKTEARRWFNENVVPRLNRGAPSPDVSFDAFCDVFLERHGATIAPGSRDTLKARLKPARRQFGDWTLRELEHAAVDVAAARATLLEGSRYQLTSALRQALGAAVRWRYIGRNPAVDAGRNPQPRTEELLPFTPDEIAALGQIVCTLTRVPDITGVQSTRDGQIVKVPRADASLTTGPLTAADYQALISPSPTR